MEETWKQVVGDFNERQRMGNVEVIDIDREYIKEAVAYLLERGFGAYILGSDTLSFEKIRDRTNRISVGDRGEDGFRIYLPYSNPDYETIKKDLTDLAQ